MIIHSIKICSSCILLFQEPQKFSISTGSDFFNCRIFVSTRPSWFLLLRSPSFIFRSRYKSKMLIPSDDDSQSTHRIQYTLQNQYLSRLLFYFSVWHDLKTAVLKRYEYPNYLGITLIKLLHYNICISQTPYSWNLVIWLPPSFIWVIFPSNARNYIKICNIKKKFTLGSRC